MRTRCATSLLHRTPLHIRLQRQRAPGPNAPRAAATSSNVDDAQLPFALKRVDVQIADWGSVRVVVPASEDEARVLCCDVPGLQPLTITLPIRCLITTSRPTAATQVCKVCAGSHCRL